MFCSSLLLMSFSVLFSVSIYFQRVQNFRFASRCPWSFKFSRISRSIRNIAPPPSPTRFINGLWNCRNAYPSSQCCTPHVIFYFLQGKPLSIISRKLLIFPLSVKKISSHYVNLVSFLKEIIKAEILTHHNWKIRSCIITVEMPKEGCHQVLSYCNLGYILILV